MVGALCVVLQRGTSTPFKAFAGENLGTQEFQDPKGNHLWATKHGYQPRNTNLFGSGRFALRKSSQGKPDLRMEGHFLPRLDTFGVMEAFLAIRIWE